jgi:hypothetical protein
MIGPFSLIAPELRVTEWLRLACACAETLFAGAAGGGWG